MVGLHQKRGYLWQPVASPRQVEEHQLRVQHALELREQIAAREEKAYQERRDFLEEGNAVRATIGNLGLSGDFLCKSGVISVISGNF